MNGIKKALVALLMTIILISAGAGVLWHARHYVMIDFKFYAKDAGTLDLRGEELSPERYEKISARLPDCDILWNVPFQGKRYAEDTGALTITSLTDGDVEALDYLTELEHVNADGCADYPQLLALQDRRPEVEVSYSVVLGSNSYAPDAEEVVITAIAEDEIPLLKCLRSLKTVVIGGGADTENFGALQKYCHENGYGFQIRIGDIQTEDDVQTLTVSGLKPGEEKLLQFLPNMTKLHLLNPEASAESLEALKTACPDAEITWEQEVCGKRFYCTDTQIDISGIPVEDMEELANRMTYFPGAEKLIMSDCGVDNETMAQFREAHREDYKVVWTVQLGDKLTARTDDTTFMPTREKVYYFQDHESGNLRYCEDMVCIDIGHMAIHDISFVEYMPNLQYLILAHTEVRDISPLASCKKLIFLELDWSTVRDFTPLLECTALQDLNVGKTYPSLEPIAQMTWLKNLWMVGRTTGAYEVTQALTETKIVTSGSATVAGGWRDLPNYYAMRDLLGMPYMTW